MRWMVNRLYGGAKVAHKLHLPYSTQTQLINRLELI